MSTVGFAVSATPVRVSRRAGTAVFAAVVGLLAILLFAKGSGPGGFATFDLSAPDTVYVPSLVVPVYATCLGCGVACLLLALAHAAHRFGRRGTYVTIAIVLVLGVFAFLCWAGAGQTLSLVGLASSTLLRSIPLVLGALAGLLCERSGVINVAIEGELLLGAFAGAVIGSALGNLWLGMVAAAVAGGLLGALLAVFAIRYVVDHIILGVVLNVFALGLTGFFYDRILIPYQETLNSPQTFDRFKIPLLGDIPIIGPVLFDGNVFLYLTYIALAVLQVALFRTRWGLRTRAVGEHPAAADTVGVRVLATRYRNVIMGGMLAGIGGAYLTIGSVGAFGKNISSGKGFIALAALIFGQWKPMGALFAALLFGFADALQNLLSVLGAPIPSSFLLMTPYLATIFAVAGLVGKARPPKADGVPYVKQ